MSLSKHICKCGGCLMRSTEKIYTVYGNKTGYRLENRSGETVDKFIVDDCLLKSLNENEKCDYLFTHGNNGFFVELKGGNVRKAIRQLLNSIGILKDNFTGALFARIVSSNFKKAPDIKSSQEYRRLLKLTNNNLIIKSVWLTESLYKKSE